MFLETRQCSWEQGIISGNKALFLRTRHCPQGQGVFRADASMYPTIIPVRTRRDMYKLSDLKSLHEMPFAFLDNAHFTRAKLHRIFQIRFANDTDSSRDHKQDLVSIRMNLACMRRRMPRIHVDNSDRHPVHPFRRPGLTRTSRNGQIPPDIDKIFRNVHTTDFSHSPSSALKNTHLSLYIKGRSAGLTQW